MDFVIFLPALAVFALFGGIWLIARSAQPAADASGGSWTSPVESIPGSGIRHAHGQSQGQRERQEDEVGHISGNTLDPLGNHSVLVVADGMGGHAAGDAASQAAVRGFLAAYGTRGQPHDRLRSGLDRANAAIAEETESHPEWSGMGTTLVAAAVAEAGLQWISVGDSLLCLFRDGKLERLNEDHSMRPVIAELRARGDAETDFYRPNQLRSVLMGDEIAKIDAPEEPFPLKAGDFVVLATDGLETLSDEEIASLLAGDAAGPAAACQALLAAVEAKDHPRQDNTSLFVVEVEADSTTTDEQT